MESYRSHSSYATELFFVKRFVVDWGILSSKSFRQFLNWRSSFHLILSISRLSSKNGQFQNITIIILGWKNLVVKFSKCFYYTWAKLTVCECNLYCIYVYFYILFIQNYYSNKAKNFRYFASITVGGESYNCREREL